MKSILLIIGLLVTIPAQAYDLKCVNAYEGSFLVDLLDCRQHIVKDPNCYSGVTDAPYPEGYLGLVNFNVITCKTENNTVIQGVSTSFGAGIMSVSMVGQVLLDYDFMISLQEFQLKSF